MKLTKNNLASKREETYFVILAILAALAWLGIAISIIGLVYAVSIAIFIWIGNGLMVASIKANSVEAGENQFSDLYKIYKEVAAQLGATELPRLYILQAEGALNAFATRHSGRNFIVIYSSLYESLGSDSEEMRFLIGHEFGHIIKRHVLKFIFLMPASWLPLLGAAYRRSVEETCDRFGTFAARSTESAARAMTILAAGKDPGKAANIERFAEQYRRDRGFFVSWLELSSTYPTLSQRTDHILSSAKEEYPRRASRNLLAYPCALFLNTTTIIIAFVVIYMGAVGVAMMEEIDAESMEESASASEAGGHNQYEEYQEDDVAYGEEE